MGRRDRERKERIQQGDELPIAQRALRNPVLRRGIQLASKGRVMQELQRASTPDQIEALDTLVGSQRPEALRVAITKKAPKEMDKGIKKFQKEGKPVTVDTLCAEIKTTPGFLAMCERVGLNLAWFEVLAQERMKRAGL